MSVGERLQLATTIVLTVGVIATVIVAVLQKRQSDRVMKGTLMRDFSNEFFTKDYLRNVRLGLSEFGLERLREPANLSPLPPEGFQLMDFFDVVAAYYNKKALDEEMAFVAFYYWISHYWTAFGADVQSFMGRTGMRTHANLEGMAVSLPAVGVKLKRIKKGFVVTPERLREFFEDEIRECKGKSREQKDKIG